MIAAGGDYLVIATDEGGLIGAAVVHQGPDGELLAHFDLHSWENAQAEAHQIDPRPRLRDGELLFRHQEAAIDLGMTFDEYVELVVLPRQPALAARLREVAELWD